MNFSIVYVYVYGLFVGFISILVALGGLLMVLERVYAGLYRALRI